MGLILVDSSVWIDFLNRRSTPQTVAVRHLATAKRRLAIGDLVMTEVLQGTRTQASLIATRCILNDISLLYADCDFDPFVEHLGLVAVDGSRNQPN